MRKKEFIIIIILILSFIFYKSIQLYIYKVEPVDFDKTTIFNYEIDIKTKEEKNIDLLDIDGILVKNYFKEYEKGPDGSDFNVLRDKDNNIVSFYYITSMKEYVDSISFEALSIDVDNQVDTINKSEVDFNLKKYFIKNNINNDVDLFRHIKDNYYFKSNILMSRRDIRSYFLLNSFVSVSLPSFNSIYLIKGDLTGYIVNNNNIREIHLLHNKKQYVIVLGGEASKDEFINNILETVHYK